MLIDTYKTSSRPTSPISLPLSPGPYPAYIHGVFLPLPSLPFSSPFYPVTSFQLPFLPLPSPPLRSSPPLLRLEGLGERSSSPSGSGRSPAAERFLVNCRLKVAPFVEGMQEIPVHDRSQNVSKQTTLSQNLTYARV